MEAMAVRASDDTVDPPPTVECSGDEVARAQGGDVRAFEALYRAHAPRIHGLCRRLTGSASNAEDLTQEVFVRAWQRLRSFRGESAFSTWLHRLAVNVVLGHLRAHRPAPTVWEGDRPASHRATALRIDLEEAIASLPPSARMVFVLHDVEGYRHEEIAALARIAVGTSKAHLHRARRLLREALKP